jgi:hypothetical protein
MKRHVAPSGLDFTVAMLARIHMEELEREAEQQRLASLVRPARPNGRSPLSMLARWLCARWDRPSDGDRIRDATALPA